MNSVFNKDSFHEVLLCDVFPGGLNTEDSMLLFALLHTHRIHLVHASISNAPNIRSLSAITQRHCAECIACLNKNRRKVEEEKKHGAFWYWKWSEEWSYERIDSLSVQERDRLEDLRRAIEAHPAINSMEPDDN